MKSIYVFLFIFLQLPAFTQIVHTRPYISTPITWDSALEEFERDFLDKPFKTPNPKIILSFEEIIFIDGDTLTIFLNDSPECLEDSISVDRIWKSAIDTKYQNCFISLFYFKNENEYGLRLFYPEDKHGFEYYMKPFKVDIIPYKKD